MSDETPLTHHEVEEAFDGWKWGRGSTEPDARVTVLYDPHAVAAEDAKYLVRHERQWFWTVDFAEHQERIRRVDPDGLLDSWQEKMTQVSTELRVPTADELRAGGFPVPGQWEPVEDEQSYPVAQIIEGTELLERDPTDVLTVMKAQAKFQASLAATSLELLSLLTEEFEYRKTRDELKDHPPITVEESESAVNESAHRSEGLIGTPDFPYAGFQER